MKTFLFDIDNEYKVARDNNNKFLTLPEYDKLTKNIVSKYCKNKSVRNFILANADLLAEISYKIMIGDWRYNNTKGKTQANYRIQCGIWALKRVYEKMNSTPDILSTSQKTNQQNGNDNVKEIEDWLYTTENPLEKIEIQEIIQKSKLNEKQRDIVQQLLNGQKIKEIAQNNKVSKNAIYNQVNIIKEKIKKASNVI